MTGKFSPLLLNNRIVWNVGLVATCLLAGGCSIFSPQAGSLADYEEARKSIEDPDGMYRPEGAAIEKKTGKTFFDRIGTSARRRKDIDKARNFYREGDADFERAKSLEGEARTAAFRKAAENYGKAADNWRSSGLEQDALLMAAESHFFAEDYYRSENLYARLIKEYPRNPYLDHVDSRRFEIADYWIKHDEEDHKPFFMVNFVDYKFPWNDTGGNGRRVLEKMRLDNPTGKISDDATMRLAVQDYSKGNFEDAADTFADLRMTYPDSEHQFNAQFLELQSLLASYQGPRYSAIPITDAEKRIKQLATQFPVESEKRRKELQEAYAEVRFRKAERIWNQATYRKDRNENGSAKFHYQKIVEEYSDTEFAEEAREELSKLEGQPDDPPQRFKPLIWLFQANDDKRPWLDN